MKGELELVDEDQYFGVNVKKIGQEEVVVGGRGDGEIMVSLSHAQVMDWPEKTVGRGWNWPGDRRTHPAEKV